MSISDQRSAVSDQLSAISFQEEISRQRSAFSYQRSAKELSAISWDIFHLFTWVFVLLIGPV